jgi:hypothetical protein
MSDKALPVYKKVFMSQDLADRIEAEVNRRPSLYRNDQNQLSEGELMRRALDFYLDNVANQSTDGQRQTA